MSAKTTTTRPTRRSERRRRRPASSPRASARAAVAAAASALMALTTSAPPSVQPTTTVRSCTSSSPRAAAGQEPGRDARRRGATPAVGGRREGPGARGARSSAASGARRGPPRRGALRTNASRAGLRRRHQANASDHEEPRHAPRPALPGETPARRSLSRTDRIHRRGDVPVVTQDQEQMARLRAGLIQARRGEPGDRPRASPAEREGSSAEPLAVERGDLVQQGRGALLAQRALLAARLAMPLHATRRSRARSDSVEISAGRPRADRAQRGTLGRASRERVERGAELVARGAQRPGGRRRSRPRRRAGSPRRRAPGAASRARRRGGPRAWRAPAEARGAATTARSTSMRRAQLLMDLALGLRACDPGEVGGQGRGARPGSRGVSLPRAGPSGR